MIVLFAMAVPAHAWDDETHLAIAEAAGYKKWYNAAAADIARVKLGRREGYNHYHSSRKGTVITPEMVLQQAKRYGYDIPDGHLYGAIIGSLRAYMTAKRGSKEADHYMAYVVHYVGDLSMPLHHTPLSKQNLKHHNANDAIIDDVVFANLDRIPIYPITIKSEDDLAAEVARIANLSKTLGHEIEAEDRLLTFLEAYQMISHSASLLKAILEYAEDQ